MPLVYDDVPGSWGKQSEGWPAIHDPDGTARGLVIQNKLVPYGSYVTGDDELRLETSEYVAKVRAALASKRPPPSAPVGVEELPKGWMRDRKEVVELAEHLEGEGWRQDERGDVQCFDQGSAMAAEVIRHVLIPILDGAQIVAFAQQPAAVDEVVLAAVLAEREACAKACDDRAAYYHAGDDDGPNTRRGMACEACASVIRWRSTVSPSFLAKHEAEIADRLAAQQGGSDDR